MPVDLDETYSRLPVQLTRKRVHLNTPTVIPQAMSDDSIITHVVSVSLMPCNVTNLNRLAYTPSQLRLEALHRPSVKQRNGTQPKAAESAGSTYHSPAQLTTKPRTSMVALLTQ